MKKTILALAFMLGCGGSSSGGAVTDEPLPEPAPCAPAPQGFVAWRSDDGVVHVSKQLSGKPSAGGIETYAEIRHVSGDSLPSVIVFGPEQIEVRQDLSLCLVDG